VLAQDAAVVTGGAHQQDDPDDTTVTKLELGPALHGLHVAESSLGIDSDPLIARDDRVPRSLIPIPAHEHLRAPPKAFVDLGAKPLEQPKLCFISNGEPFWVGLDRKAQSQRRAVPPELIEPWWDAPAPLCAADA
jgi:hypothetical protein